MTRPLVLVALVVQLGFILWGSRIVYHDYRRGVISTDRRWIAGALAATGFLLFSLYGGQIPR